MARVVQYSKFGGPEVLEVIETEPQHPGPGQLRVQVRAAGLNPVDHKIFAGGPSAAAYGAKPPIGVGHDFSGEVDEVGKGVKGFSVGDLVFGGKRNDAIADFVIIDADDLILPKPEGLDLDVAGALAIAGRTAWAGNAALEIGSEDTVFVSAAAGGVGLLAAQVAIRRGAVVVGSASEANHEFLREIGVIPVAYGPGLAGRVREAAPDGVTAVFDTHGSETIDAALDLGVPIERVNTIAARGYRDAKGAGSVDATKEDLAELADLVAAGTIVLPLQAIFPIERVTEAYDRLMTGHLRGKIVVVTQ